MFRIACASLFAVLIALPTALAAAGYPEKPIRLVIPFPPGGGTDILARGLQDKLEAALGASVIIDNRGGAGGTIGCTVAARAAPDGYTLLFTSASYTFAPGLYKKDLPYDAINDLKPITNFAQSPLILNVHPSMPVLSIRELIALARKSPGKILYASAGVGSNIHMSTELFKYMSKINLEQVPYKGGGPATVALISGEVQVLITTIMSSIPHMRTGRMRGLAVSTRQRSPVVPDLPTIDEAGVPGYDKAVWFGLFAPAAVPEPIVTHVYKAIAAVLKNPDTVKRLATDGAVAVGNSPEEFGAFVRSEIAEWTKLIRDMKL
jgi:tripartite-type tricarboxylate transporter receptor subunit TctC